MTILKNRLMKTPHFEQESFSAPRVLQLRYQVAEGEGQHLEFKRRASDPERIAREMVAFANSGGGTLLVGVADNGSIPGLKYPEEESYVIRRAIEKYIRPALPFSEEVIAVAPARFVLAYHIKAGKKYLYQIRQGRKLTCFVRVQDKSLKASYEMKTVLRYRNRNRNMLIRYGEHEQLLMKYLSEYNTITVGHFAKLANLPYRQASQKLVYLVLANMLKLTATEAGDLYSLAFPADEGR